MFFFGFLFVIGIFFCLLFFSRKAFPKGRPRNIYLCTVMGVLAFYPFAYLLTPAYSTFKELCQQANGFQIQKRLHVSFISSEFDIGNDCAKGPAYIAKQGYAGFDCKGNNGLFTYRFSKTATWREGCGLECFQSVRLEVPQANYRREYRYGFVAGKNPKVTSGYGANMQNVIQQDSKLVFTDQLVVHNDEVLAYSRAFRYYPYGNGWAQILGLASGTAPSQSCSPTFGLMDLRKVFPPLETN
jgi:hypothetical protein